MDVQTGSGGDKCYYFSNTKLHRFTVTGKDGETATYYVKPSTTTSDSSYISYNTQSNLRVARPAAASAVTGTVKASGSWTASSDVSWLSISLAKGSSGSTSVTLSTAANSGAARTGTISFKLGSVVYARMVVTQTAKDGDTLTLNLAENPGQRRSGTVTVSCGTASAVIRVTQCAKLTDWPQLGSPQLSDDVASPTVLEKTDTLTFTWPVEPQADYYRLRIVSCPQNSAYTIGSSTLYLSKYASAWSGGTASCTLDVSGLDEGVTYKLQLHRAASNGARANVYYFTFLAPEPYLELRGERTTAVDNETLEFYAEGGEDSAYYHVN